MNVSDAKRWLSGPRNFNEGVIILNELSDNALVKTMCKYENSMSIDLLAKELERLASLVTDGPHNGSIDWRNYPDELQELRPKLVDLLRKRDSLKSRGLWYESQELRFEAAKSIIEVGKHIRLIFDELDYFNEHGVVKPKAVETSERVHPNQINNFTKYKELTLQASTAAPYYHAGKPKCSRDY